MNQHTPELIAQANLWRQMYNPLRGLGMVRAASLLEQGEQGIYADLAWLYRFVMKRSAVVRATNRKRTGALLKMGHDIRIVSEDKMPEGMEKVAKKQQDALRKAYEAVDNMDRAKAFLASADYYGFAHLEKHFDEGGKVTHLEPVPQWHWNRRGPYAPWHYDPRAQAGHGGTAIDPASFIIREVEDPIMEVALVAYLRGELGEKDWTGFIETFGIPSIFAILPPNIPPDKVEEYQAMVEGVVADSRGAAPHGTDFKITDTAMKGTAPFKEYLDHQDSRIVLAATGGRLTMLAESGTGTLAGGAHADTFDDIAGEIGAEISEVFQTQFDKPILDALFPGQPRLAYFAIAHEDAEDVDKLFERNAKLAPSGLRITMDDLAEKSGYDIEPLPQVGSGQSEVGSDALAVRNRARPDAGGDALARAGIEEAAKALQADFKPVAEALGALLKKVDDANLTDAQVADAMTAFAEVRLPKLLAEMGKGAELDAVLERILGTEMAAGIAGRKEGGAA